MPRKGPVTKRDAPDPVYNSKLVTRLINRIMLDGKEVLLKASFTIRSTSSRNVLVMIRWKCLKHIKNIMPVLEVKARRVGGANYQVPIEVKPERRTSLGLRWLVNYSRNRGEKTMEERLAAEIIDASNNTGASVKKREDTHKMAEANKAFAHYRW